MTKSEWWPSRSLICDLSGLKTRLVLTKENLRLHHALPAFGSGSVKPLTGRFIVRHVEGWICPCLDGVGEEEDVMRAGLK